MSLILSAELAATCNALGTVDPVTQKYLGDTDANTVETVKDLIRYLRRDNEAYDTRRQLGATAVVQTNLIPLIKLKWENEELFDVLLRLVGNLTSPVLLLYNEEIPTDKVVRNHFLQILGHLQSYKEAFADEELWKVLGNRLQILLNKSWQDRSEDEGLIIERILILVRNILSIPPDPDVEKCTDNGISIHDKVIWTLRHAQITDILLYIVSSDDEEAYYIYVLEILSLLLKEQTPSELATAAPQRSETEKIRDEAELLSIRHRESLQKSERVRKFTGARHSRFGGTFVVKNLKSINDENELIYHKPLNKLDALDFDVDKARKKTPKNRLPLPSTSTSRRTIFAMRLFLKDFCIEFLKGGYNKLMRNTAMRLERAKSVMHDESYYLWTMTFFMEFNRLYKFDIKLVSETMSQRIFHKVLQQMENNYDMVATDKKKMQLWSRRLHIAVKAYRELIFTLSTMEKSPDISVRETAMVIKSNVFYQVEYRECLIQFLVNYTPIKFSNEYLVDLIQTQHIFFKMLEAYCQDNRSVVVQQKKRVIKKKNQKEASAPEREKGPESLEDQFDEFAPQITTILEGGGNIPTDVVPFDASSDKPIDEQKVDAMLRIQRYLREREFETAIGLLRAAREVWPENDSFGSNTMAPEEEFLAVRDIFLAELQDEATNRNKMRTKEAVQEEQEDYSDEEDEEEEMASGMQHFTETDFKFEDFAKRLAHPKIVEACGLVLRTFDKNSVNTNHCVLKLLHRIAWDCRMPTMIFQASIFRTFQRIFSERTMPQYKELVKFATYIVRQFVKVGEKNHKVFMELLFWKNSRDAYDIEEGYGSYEQKSQATKTAWTEEEENELRVLVVEYREKGIQEDAIDWIQNNLINNTRTRRAILKKLKEMMLMTDYKGPKKNSQISSRPPREWEEHEITQLTELFEEFRDATDPLGCILSRLTVKRPKNRVADKILELGLVQDKKELRKKRTTKSQTNRSAGRNEFESGSESERDIDSAANSDEEIQQPVRTNKPSQRNKSRKSSKKPAKKSLPRQATQAEIAKLLIDVVEKGMSTSLEWIHESLTDAADDLEQEPDANDDTGVPIVPIAQPDIQAMEDEVFQKMLLAIGICQPADEQETYWRIPALLSVEDLRKICSTITEALEGKLTLAEETPTVVACTQDDESSDEDVFDRLRSFVQKSDNEDNIIEKDIEGRDKKEKSLDLYEASTSKKKMKKKKDINEENDDDNKFLDQDDNEDINLNASVSSNKKTKNKKRKIIPASDSEEENINDATNTDENIPSLEKNGYHSDGSSYSHNPSKSFNRRIIDESDSENNEIPDSTTEAYTLDESMTMQEENSKRNRENDSESEEDQRKTKKKRHIISDDED